MVVFTSNPKHFQTITERLREWFVHAIQYIFLFQLLLHIQERQGINSTHFLAFHLEFLQIFNLFLSKTHIFIKFQIFANVCVNE